jgi:hypothetical protein
MQTSTGPSLFVRTTIVIIAVIQIVLGLIFILNPTSFPLLLGLPAAPPWTDWLFAMFGARALGFACGMLVSLRDIQRHASWLAAMILVQAIDWIGTLLAVHAGKVTLYQVSTASFLPILFIAVLTTELLRQRSAEREMETR